ncbi:NUDIX hydrolase [Roseomonas sp. BN140053]|uniref:NUDIX hydrolase n=1 Tax=Roseomonas sp. BN140053 TaxID=3391898 RepID=UPI0039E76E6F
MRSEPRAAAPATLRAAAARSPGPALPASAAEGRKRRPAPRRTSCGVIVTDGERILLGRPPRFPLWDIPKGLAEAGEEHAAAALRELREETGLRAPAEALVSLGVHAYLRTKDLALFAWFRAAAEMPDPAALRCTSTVRLPDGTRVPEIAQFAVLPWAEALGRVGGNLARLLGPIRDAPPWPVAPGG